MAATETCYHQCPTCRREWAHRVPAFSDIDAYFLRCRNCMPEDVVGAIMRDAPRPPDEDLAALGRLLRETEVLTDDVPRDIQALELRERYLSRQT